MKLNLLSSVMLASCYLINKAESRWATTPGEAFNYVLGHDVEISQEKAKVVDIDVNKSAEKIQQLHNAGIKVICYFSGGTLEDFRDDYNDFKAVKNLVRNTFIDWPDETWLDYRVEGIKPLMKKRMQTAVNKKCDGIEVDNLDGYTMDEVKEWTNPLKKEDAIAYAKWLAETAHSLNISIGLKNTLGIIDDVGSYFDFAVNEECIQYNECKRYKNFIAQGKAVYGVTYGGMDKNKDALCKNLNGLGMSMIVKPGSKLVQEGTIFNGKSVCGSSFDNGLSSITKANTAVAKNVTTTVAKKPTTTVAKKPTTTVAKKPTTTVAKKPTTTVAKKPHTRKSHTRKPHTRKHTRRPHSVVRKATVVPRKTNKSKKVTVVKVVTKVVKKN